ncbi:MAG: glycosyltransferase 87 family protein [Hyphomicrobiaceae bacterium]
MDKRLSEKPWQDLHANADMARGRIGMAACFLTAVLLHLAVWQISEPPTLFSDFYKAYYPAAEMLWNSGVSWPLTETGAGGFVNIPILAWLFVPLVLLGETEAGWAFLGIGVAATVCTCLLLMRMARSGTRSGLLIPLLFLLNGPLINSLREGNTTHLILLMLVVALLLWRRGNDFTAGLLLGLCAIIKLPLMLYGVYFLLRGRWRVVAGGATTIGSVALISLVVFGMRSNVAWFDCCVEPFIGGILPAFNVQSFDGFAIRLITGASQLAVWEPLDLPIAYRVIRVLAFAAVFCAVAVVFVRAGRATATDQARSRARETLEYVLILNLALVMSPVSWTHYYLLMLLPWSLYLGGLLRLPQDAVTRRLVWASIVLSSLPVIFVPLSTEWLGELAARTIVSAWFFGGIAMLIALVRAAWLAAHAVASERPIAKTAF